MTDFNHEGNVATSYKGTKPVLMQDGKIFTFAEYNRFTKKWEPEPKLIDDDAQYEEMSTDVEKLLKKMMTIEEQKLSTIRLLLDEYGVKARQSRMSLKETVQKQAGEIWRIKGRLQTVEDEEEIIKLKDKIKELESQKKKPGRPKTKVKEDGE